MHRAGARAHLRVVDGRADAIRESQCRAGIRSREQHAKLLPAIAHQQILPAKAIADLARKLPEDVVAHQVAEGVVDALEMVHVQHQQAKRQAAATAPGEFPLCEFNEGPAVENAGQRIDRGKLVHFVLGALLVHEQKTEGTQHDRGNGQKITEARSQPALGRNERHCRCDDSQQGTREEHRHQQAIGDHHQHARAALMVDVALANLPENRKAAQSLRQVADGNEGCVSSRHQDASYDDRRRDKPCNGQGASMELHQRCRLHHETRRKHEASRNEDQIRGDDIVGGKYGPGAGLREQGRAPLSQTLAGCVRERRPQRARHDGVAHHENG